MPEPETGIRGYLFQVGGRKIPFDREEVLLFRRPHPNHDILGLPDPLCLDKMSSVVDLGMYDDGSGFIY